MAKEPGACWWASSTLGRNCYFLLSHYITAHFFSPGCQILQLWQSLWHHPAISGNTPGYGNNKPSLTLFK